MLVALLMLGLSGPACAGEEKSRPALSDSTYVSVMAQLAAIRRAEGQGAAAPADRQVRETMEAVLRQADVDGDALLDFARQVGDEPERMANLWERIQGAADSLHEAGWDPPGPLPPLRRDGGP